MESVNRSKQEVVTNYYDGKKYILVSINGSEMYVSEEKYSQISSQNQKKTAA